MESYDIYDNWDAWEVDMVIIEDLMTDFVSLQGTLADGPGQILKANRLGDDLGKLAGKLYRFAALQNVTNTADNETAAKVQRVRILFSKFGRRCKQRHRTTSPLCSLAQKSFGTG